MNHFQNIRNCGSVHNTVNAKKIKKLIKTKKNEICSKSKNIFHETIAYIFHTSVYFLFHDQDILPEAATRGVLWKKGVLRNFTKFTGKHLFHSLFFNKVVGLRSVTMLKKRLWYSCFPVNIAKFLRIPFLHNTSGRLTYCWISFSTAKLFNPLSANL